MEEICGFTVVHLKKTVLYCTANKHITYSFLNLLAFVTFINYTQVVSLVLCCNGGPKHSRSIPYIKHVLLQLARHMWMVPIANQ